MKELSKLEAFKLDKNHMNEIVGGRSMVRCACGMGADTYFAFRARSYDEGLNWVAAHCDYGVGGCFM